MRKIKLLLVLIALVSFLSFGTPAATRASGYYETPPAVVFVQDRNDKMLVRHNFQYDKRIFIPGNTEKDPGFYINIPGAD